MSAHPNTSLQIDIGRAFAFVFEDEEWLKKILIGGAFSLIPLFGSLIVYGYMIEVAHRVYYAPNTGELPEWDDIGSYLTRGFFFWLGLLIWALPFILIVSCSILVAIGLGIAANEEVVIGVSLTLFYCAILPLIFLFTIGASLVIPLLLGRYAIHRRFAALFEFSEIFADLRRIGFVPLLLLVVIYHVAGYVGQLGIALCLIGVIFTGFYGNIVIGHAAGQNYRLARGLQPPPAIPIAATAT